MPSSGGAGIIAPERSLSPDSTGPAREQPCGGGGWSTSVPFKTAILIFNQDAFRRLVSAGTNTLPNFTQCSIWTAIDRSAIFALQRTTFSTLRTRT